MGNNSSQFSVGGFSEQEVQRIQRRFQRMAKGSEVQFKDIAAQPEFVGNPVSKRVLDIFDSNSDGAMTYDEVFNMLSTFPRLADNKAKAEFVFKAYDLNGDSFVCKDDLHGMLRMVSAGGGMSDAQLRAVAAATVAYYDRDMDGRLSQPEFAAMLADEDAILT